MAVGAAVDGHAVAEPQLPADVPVPQAAQPVEVRPRVALGVPSHPARLRGGDRVVTQLAHAQPPLLADQGLDHVVAALAVARLLRVGLLLDEQAVGRQAYTY